MMAGKELIYKDDARKAVLKANRAIAYCIDNIKTVDAVEVVRCKDCDKWKEHPDGIFIRRFGYCKECMMDMPADGFCSYGERRADNANDHCND